jgi:serine protease
MRMHLHRRGDSTRAGCSGGERMIPARIPDGKHRVAPRPPRRVSILVLLFLLFASLHLAAPTPAAAQAQSWLQVLPQGLEPGLRWPGYAPGELLVKFNEKVAPAQRKLAVAAEGADLIDAVTPDGLVKVRLGPGQTVGAAIERWSARGDVEYAAPNLYARGFLTPNDSVIATFDLAWNLRSVDAYDAWDVVTGDPSIVLAIIDSGVAFEDRAIPAHELRFVTPGITRYRRSPDLPGPFLPGWDFVNDDPNPDDDNGHGTRVATIAAGAANNVAGSAGIAFGVTILPIKVLDYRTDSSMEWIVKGIRFAADQGADVVNLSLGFPPLATFRALGFNESELAHMFAPLRDAVSYAQRRGCILVGASGNFDASDVSLPAGYPGVIAVGATGVDDRRSSFSSYGTALDFVAPGGDFTDLNNDHVQDGVAVLSIKPFRSDGSLANPDSFGVFFFFGTSAAAPHVAGAVALLRSMGLRDQGAIEQTLRASAVHPFRINAGFDPEYGAGLIKIGRAVRNPVGSAASAASHSSVSDEGPIGPRLLSPNPTRGPSRIAYRTARAGASRVRVFDVRGTLIRTLEERSLAPGGHEIEWDGRDRHGAHVASGIYLLRIETSEGAATRRVALLR